MRFQCKVALIWCEWFTHRAYTHWVHVGVKVWDCRFCILRGHRLNFIYFDVSLSLKVVLILANSADLDKRQTYAAFHLGQTIRLGVSNILRINTLRLWNTDNP